MIETLREIALGYPGAWEDHPWGEDVVKIEKRIFVFFGTPDEHGRHDGFGLKLPGSQEMALSLEYVKPSGYGLGKAGWVNVTRPPEDAPWELFIEWIEESYRSVAPKRRMAQLEAQKPA